MDVVEWSALVYLHVVESNSEKISESKLFLKFSLD